MPELSATRLVGGTALALQIGHRESIDLDLFGQTGDSGSALALQLSGLGSVSIVSSSKSMMFFRINGIKVDIVNYPYKWLGDSITEDGIRLASMQDIAAMKVAAITNRGARKDFIDMFFLLKKFNMSQIMGFYGAKFPEATFFAALKSMTYFADAERDPMPKMLVPIDWNHVRSVITEAVSDYVCRIDSESMAKQ